MTDLTDAWLARTAKACERVNRERARDERNEALHDDLHGALPDHPATRAKLDCGCVWKCDGWESGSVYERGTAKLYPINPGYVKECDAHS